MVPLAFSNTRAKTFPDGNGYASDRGQTVEKLAGPAVLRAFYGLPRMNAPCDP